LIDLIRHILNPYLRTPAMAAGISAHNWSVEEIVKLGVE